MPKYLIIAYRKPHVKESVFTTFMDDDYRKTNYVDNLMRLGFRVSVYEWCESEDDNEMPYYKILCECFQLGY